MAAIKTDTTTVPFGENENTASFLLFGRAGGH